MGGVGCWALSMVGFVGGLSAAAAMMVMYFSVLVLIPT